MEQRWIVSGGGPLVFLPRRVLPSWRGSDACPGEDTTDYDRACAVPGSIGCIPIVGAASEEVALILAKDPQLTTWMFSAGGRGAPVGALVTCVCADDLEVAARCARDAMQDDGAWEPFESMLTFAADDWLLFDSCYTGQEAGEATEVVRVQLRPGSYSLRTRFHERGSTHLILHSLTREPLEDARAAT